MRGAEDRRAGDNFVDLEGHSNTHRASAVLQSIDAASGILYNIPIPSGCSVRELREAVQGASAVREQRAAQGSDGGVVAATERIELLCIDESCDDGPVVLEDGRWLSHYSLPHEEKKVYAYRLGSIDGSGSGGCSGSGGGTRGHETQSHAMGVGAELRELLHSTTALSRSGTLHLSGRASSCESPLPEHTPAIVRDLVVLSRAMQEKETRVESRLSFASKQVDAMSRALVEAKVQDDAIEILCWYADDKERRARENEEINSVDEAQTELNKEVARKHAQRLFQHHRATVLRLAMPGSADRALAGWLLQGGVDGDGRADNMLDLVGKRQRIDHVLHVCQAKLVEEVFSRRKSMSSVSSRGSVERRAAVMTGGGEVGTVGAMVWVGGEGGEDDPDCMSVKRRSVSLDVDNTYEVVMQTIANNVRKAQKKLESIQTRRAAVHAAVGETVDRTRRLSASCVSFSTSATHSTPAQQPDAILAQEVRSAEEEATLARIWVDGESKVVDELANEVTSLSHVCGQQLHKWQDLVSRDLLHGLSAAFPNAAHGEGVDTLAALDFAKTVDVLGLELGEVEGVYEAVREEVMRRAAFETAYRQTLRHFVSQMEAAREIEREHRSSFWKLPGVGAFLEVDKGGGGSASTGSTGSTGEVRGERVGGSRVGTAAAFLKHTGDPPELAAAIRPYAPVPSAGGEGGCGGGGLCAPLPEVTRIVLSSTDKRGGGVGVQKLLHAYLAHATQAPATAQLPSALRARAAMESGEVECGGGAHKGVCGDDLEYSCVSLTSSDIRCARGGDGGSDVRSSHAVEVAVKKEKERMQGEIEKLSKEWEIERASERKAVRDREQEQATAKENESERQRERDREKDQGLRRLLTLERKSQTVSEELAHQQACAREYEKEREQRLEDEHLRLCAHVDAVERLEEAVATVENAMSFIVGHMQRARERQTVQEEERIRDRVAAVAAEEHVNDAGRGEVEGKKEEEQEDQEEENNDPELMCSQLMMEVKREREELRGTLLALAESRFSFADDSSPAGQVQLLKNALKRASQCHELDEVHAANEKALALAPHLLSVQDALARSRMSMHDFSRVLGLLPLSPQASPLSHPWPPRGGGSGGLSGAAALAAHRADPAAGTGPATCIDALTEQVAGVRSEALVLAERMGVLTDSLQRSPAARSRA